MNQSLTFRWTDFPMIVNREPILATIEVTLEPRMSVTLQLDIDGRAYNVALQGERLAKHLFFTLNRVVADVQKAEPHIETEVIRAHTQTIMWEGLILTIGEEPSTINPLITATRETVTLNFTIGRRRFTIQTANLGALRHIAAVIGEGTKSTIRAQRFVA